MLKSLLDGHSQLAAPDFPAHSDFGLPFLMAMSAVICAVIFGHYRPLKAQGRKIVMLQDLPGRPFYVAEFYLPSLINGEEKNALTPISACCGDLPR